MASQELFLQPLVTPLYDNSSFFCPQFPWVLFILLYGGGILKKTYPIRFSCLHIYKPNDRQVTHINLSLHRPVYTHIHIYAQTHPRTYIFPPYIFNLVWFACCMYVCLSVWEPSFLWVHMETRGSCKHISFLQLTFGDTFSH